MTAERLDPITWNCVSYEFSDRIKFLRGTTGKGMSDAYAGSHPGPVHTVKWFLGKTKTCTIPCEKLKQTK